MLAKERVTHAILFEIIALLILVPIAALFTGKETTSMLFVGIMLSIIAVIWNYFYNVWFDRCYGRDRASRAFTMRIAHALGFEGGLIFVTVPIVAWFLEISLLAALLLDAAFLVFFFVYAFVFNWCYDNVKYRFANGH